MARRAPSETPDRLGLAARGALSEVIEIIRLEESGIHLILTDRPGACTAYLVKGSALPARPLLAGNDDRLSDAALNPPKDGQILVDILDPRLEGRRRAMVALNVEREWLVTPGNHTVLIVPGTVPDDSRDAYVELQRRAPDFWSLRTGMHEAFARDKPESRRWLPERASPQSPSRSTADYWLHMRDLMANWDTFRPRLPEKGLNSGLTAESESESGDVGDATDTGGSLGVPASIGPKLPIDSWPAVQWLSGQLTPDAQDVLDSALRDFDRYGQVRIYERTEDEAALVDQVALTLGLLVRSRHPHVVHLDARQGLAMAILRLLGEVEDLDWLQDDDVFDTFRAVARLRGALGETPKLVLIVTGLHQADADILQRGLPGVWLILGVESVADVMFAVVGPDYDRVEEVRQVLNRWPHGAQFIAGELVLALREAASRGWQTVTVNVPAAMAERHCGENVLAVDGWDLDRMEAWASEHFGDPVFAAHAVCMATDPRSVSLRVKMAIKALGRPREVTASARWLTTIAAWRGLRGRRRWLEPPTLTHWVLCLRLETALAEALIDLSRPLEASIIAAEGQRRAQFVPRSSNRTTILLHAIWISIKSYETLGDWAQAAERLHDFEDLVRDEGQLVGFDDLAPDWLRVRRGHRLMLSERWLDALDALDEPLVDRLRMAGSPPGNLIYSAAVMSLRTAALVSLGRLDEARESWSALRAAFVRSGQHPAYLVPMIRLAEHCLQAGATELAEQAIGEALKALRSIEPEHFDERQKCLAIALSLHGSVEWRRSRPEQARAAADEARQMVWPLFESDPDGLDQLTGHTLARAREVHPDPPPDLLDQIERFESATGMSIDAFEAVQKPPGEPIDPTARDPDRP